MLSHSAYVNGNQLEDDVLKVFSWPAGSQLSLVVSEAYAGEVESSLEMEFTAMPSLTRFVEGILGDTAALFVARNVFPLVDALQHIGFSWRLSPPELPFIPDLLNEQCSDLSLSGSVLVIEAFLCDMYSFAYGNFLGSELRVTFDPLVLFTATPIVEVDVPSFLSGIRPCIAIGELAGSYYSELVKETFSEDSWETTVLNKSLSAAWVKIGLLVEMWPSLDLTQWEPLGNKEVQQRKKGIPYRPAVSLGLQITSWEHVTYLERTVRYYASSETNAKRPPMPDRTYTEIAREVFFTFALYVDVEIGFGP